MVACDLDVIYVPAGVGRSRASQAPKLLPAPQAKHGPVYCRYEDARLGECHAIKYRGGGNFAFALLRPVASGNNPELPRLVATQKGLFTTSVYIRNDQ